MSFSNNIIDLLPNQFINPRIEVKISFTALLEIVQFNSYIFYCLFYNNQLHLQHLYLGHQFILIQNFLLTSFAYHIAYQNYHWLQHLIEVFHFIDILLFLNQSLKNKYQFSTNYFHRFFSVKYFLKKFIFFSNLMLYRV